MASATSDNTDSAESNPIQNELLCFIRQKCTIVAVDDLSKICSDFYREDEIFAAKALIERVLTHRLPKRTGNNKCRATVDDLIKVCLDPAVSLPLYFAVDLNRLPPIDINHCDVTAILAELQYLRAEVRTVGQLTSEILVLRQELSHLKSEVQKLPANDHDFPPLHSMNSREFLENQSLPPIRQVPATSAANVVREAVNSGALQSQRIRSTRKKIVVGSKVSERVKPVVTRRCVNIFLSRLHPETTVSEIEYITNEAVQCISDCDLSQVNINCTNLPGKYDFYTSFHVAITVNADLFAKATETLMCADSWPQGILVRRYFLKRQQNE